ncbi:hypothetical protein Q7A53_05720 [Halobacillus rhizosphaerae]|uniref:hypothetical protein n=1 Tax=Halobacillus rhizosphaerae TaxID=3064889 RepID=UPI00398B3CF0
MNLHEKMDTALTLLREVQEEILNGNLPDTKTNNQIQGLIRTFGKDNFVGSIETMKKWTDKIELNS